MNPDWIELVDEDEGRTAQEILDGEYEDFEFDPDTQLIVVNYDDGDSADAIVEVIPDYKIDSDDRAIAWVDKPEFVLE